MESHEQSNRTLGDLAAQYLLAYRSLRKLATDPRKRLPPPRRQERDSLSSQLFELEAAMRDKYFSNESASLSWILFRHAQHFSTEAAERVELAAGAIKEIEAWKPGAYFFQLCAELLESKSENDRMASEALLGNGKWFHKAPKHIKQRLLDGLAYPDDDPRLSELRFVQLLVCLGDPKARAHVGKLFRLIPGDYPRRELFIGFLTKRERAALARLTKRLLDEFAISPVAFTRDLLTTANRKAIEAERADASFSGVKSSDFGLVGLIGNKKALLKLSKYLQILGVDSPMLDEVVVEANRSMIEAVLSNRSLTTHETQLFENLAERYRRSNAPWGRDRREEVLPRLRGMIRTKDAQNIGPILLALLPQSYGISEFSQTNPGITAYQIGQWAAESDITELRTVGEDYLERLETLKESGTGRPSHFELG